ncbi:MAG: hypothetical protein COB46_02075 [Rhodospirillaceae bacterium]|nr:MAG: hypothetical protein COB46_02075 [Rhodospirillaceae bacterium]
MSFNDVKHAQRERLIFLDKCFCWKGRANRRDLIDQFGLSMAQAALDFKAFLIHAGDMAPEYDAVRKRYTARSDYQPVAPDETLANWRGDLQTILGIHFSELPSLTRVCDPKLLALLSRVLEKKEAIKISYTSMTTGDLSQQWIAPSQIVSDGTRIHIRAYSFKHEDFRDYVPVRINKDSSFETRLLTEPLPLDEDWHTIARITLAPCEHLSPEQAQVVRREYAFDGDTLVVDIRKALEFYTERRWGLNQPGARLECLRTEYL